MYIYIHTYSINTYAVIHPTSHTGGMCPYLVGEMPDELNSNHKTYLKRLAKNHLSDIHYIHTYIIYIMFSRLSYLLPIIFPLYTPTISPIITGRRGQISVDARPPNVPGKGRSQLPARHNVDPDAAWTGRTTCSMSFIDFPTFP